MIRLDNATVTRIKEEWTILNRKMGLREPYPEHPIWDTVSLGEQHFAIEDFVREILKLLPERRADGRTRLHTSSDLLAAD